ncbi:universal stress protein [Pedococcus ginsenosidimutans]|uniref:Universal stress protein n=1 Tax=Pedococcus ginsenosidimutans TaxID=490570 RepID=A0ABP8YIY9_9MICO
MVDNEAPRRTEPAPAGCVVVGCDGSWESLEAVDVAKREALWRGQELVVVTLEEGLGRRAHRPRDWAGASQEVAEEARSAGARALERLGAVDFPVRTVVAASAASPALEPLARQASVLVLGRHGAGGLGTFTMGSPSEALARRLGCAVMVAGPTGTTNRIPTERPNAAQAAAMARRHPVVVVGVDSSPSAEAVLGEAVAEAQTRGWPLTVVHAVGRVDAELHVEASVIWERHADLLLAQRDPDHSLARVVVDVDDPVPALLSHSGPRDLLVVGTRGEGRLAGLIAGSVARGVLDAMPCDVLVVPRHLAAPVTARADEGLASVGDA